MKERIVAAEPRPTTDAAARRRLRADQARSPTAAPSEYGDALGTFNTVDTARDMEQLRQSLGDEQADLPRLLLRHHARLHLRRAVPGQGPGAACSTARSTPTPTRRPTPRRSAKAFEAGFDAFADQLRRADRRLPDRRRTRASSSTDLLAQAAADPDPQQRGRARPGRPRPGVVMTAVQAGALRHRVLAAAGPGAGRRAEGRRGGPVLPGRQLLRAGSRTAPTPTSSTPTWRSTAPTPTRSTARARSAPWPPTGTQKYPLFGAGSAVGLYTCSVWKAHRTPLPERDAAGSAPILVVGNTGDPVTPLPGAQDMAEDLDNGVLLIWQGRGTPPTRRPTASPRRWTPT